MSNTTIISAASEKYAESLFALIGSLNCNWENHPPIVIYDIGLEQGSLKFLEEMKIEVRKVPPFCEHWRQHFTWKLWCLNDIKSENVIWIDSGLCVLNSLDEIIEEINCTGYFLVPNYQFLDWEASDDACKGCGVDYSFRTGKASIAGGLMGFKKSGDLGRLLENALEIASVENNIKATNPRHRHEQAIISILVYKNFPNPILHDGTKYLGWLSPRSTPNQKIWVHRRTMLKSDLVEFKNRIASGGKFVPKDPKEDVSLLKKIARYFYTRAKNLRRGFYMKENSENNGVR